MALPETFTQFARTAAEQLRWKKARPLVEDELLTHLCDQRDALMAGGMDETAATAESLRLTGDPYEIGTELDRVHRPKTPAALFVLAAVIALSGLAFIVLVSFADDIFAPFITRQCVALLLGTAAMLAAYFLDFTLLGRFALPLALMFHAALILLGLLPIGGFWLRYIYVSTHLLLRGLPLLFPLMFAVLLYALRGRHGWGVFAAFVCLAVQCMFCLRVPCLLDLGFLFLCDSALLIFCARNGWFGLGKKLETLLTTLPLAADIVWVLVLGANWFARQLAIVLDPHSYIDGYGYQTVVLRELLQNAKFIGPGGVGPYSAQHLARWEGFGMVDLQAHALRLAGTHRTRHAADGAACSRLPPLPQAGEYARPPRFLFRAAVVHHAGGRLSLLRPHADPHQRRCSLPVFHLWHQDDPAQHATARFSALHAARRQRRTR